MTASERGRKPPGPRQRAQALREWARTVPMSIDPFPSGETRLSLIRHCFSNYDALVAQIAGFEAGIAPSVDAYWTLKLRVNALIVSRMESSA